MGNWVLNQTNFCEVWQHCCRVQITVTLMERCCIGTGYILQGGQRENVKESVSDAAIVSMGWAVVSTAWHGVIWVTDVPSGNLSA